MTLRLTEDQDRVLQEIADAQNISKQEAIIRAIEEHAARLSMARDVEDWAQYALTRYNSLLDRLAR